MARVYERPALRLKGRLSEEQVARIRQLPWARGSGNALAREFGLSPAMISTIRNGLAYKEPRQRSKMYWSRVTDGQERYFIGPFYSSEACQNAVEQFKRTNKWPRGHVSRTPKGWYRARVELGTFETRWSAERAIEQIQKELKNIKLLGLANPERRQHARAVKDVVKDS